MVRVVKATKLRTFEASNNLVLMDADDLGRRRSTFSGLDIPRCRRPETNIQETTRIHEALEHCGELELHLSKGTAEKHRKAIDKIAEPTAYFLRRPVLCTIRNHSKFLHLPATYFTQASNFTQSGGTMSEGTTA